MKEELNKKEKEIKLLNQNICEMESNLKNEMKQVLEKNDILEKDVKYLKVENENMKARLKDQENGLGSFKKAIAHLLTKKKS